MPQTVILVHGLYMNGFSMARLAHHFHLKGYKTASFSYATTEDNYLENCQDLAALIEAQEQPCSIAAHSLGGLITQGALKLVAMDRVGHVISMGTPWQGASITAKLKRLHLEWMIGKKLPILLPRGVNNVWDYPIPLGSIAGGASFGFVRILGTADLINISELMGFIAYEFNRNKIIVVKCPVLFSEKLKYLY